jgi:exodeoxyribonuclease VII large subunit
MSDFYPEAAGDGGSPPGNVPEFSVSEISLAVKRTLEGTFERVRVRGEISGFKRAASGHLYMALKDENAVLDAVCWRGTAGRLSLAPEDGMEVIATGRITTYPGSLEIPDRHRVDGTRGRGRAHGAAGGAQEKAGRPRACSTRARKRPLPFLPRVIGVVTSPTGAVIRDILHRLADRFPRHVLVWPVLVQGETGGGSGGGDPRLQRAPAGGKIPRPDVLIVARGGGSLEDLWASTRRSSVGAPPPKATFRC